MDALTLILCRKVADIDGWSGIDTITNVGALAAVVDGKGGVMGKALLLDLMIKYEVEIDYLNPSKCTIFHIDKPLEPTVVEVGESRERAILECIVRANDL
jgi:hypothetical protein